jgi:hypothetical protein
MHVRWPDTGDRNWFRDYVLFSTKEVGTAILPRRCTVCGANPAVFEYQKHRGSHPVHGESGFCCTSCAFNVLLHAADEEARERATLGRRQASRGSYA